MMNTPFTMGGITKNNQKSILVHGGGGNPLHRSNNYIRIETAHSHENSPKAGRDLVERVIEENFNWTKYYQVQKEVQGHANGSAYASEDLKDFNKTVQKEEQYFLTKRSTIKG